MMGINQPFDTNLFFSGGAGMFISYHDVIKPVYLYAIVQMMLTGQNYGLPIHILKNMSFISVVEWYINRRYKNPLRQLDFAKKIPAEDLNELLKMTLLNDSSIYRICPTMNVIQMLQSYKSQHMSFPIYIYNEYEDPNIVEDCDKIFHGINHHCFFGDLREAISNCDQNFTYIFSDIETVKCASDILTGTYSHVLLTRDWRYNYIDNKKTLKYDLKNMASTHPFLRIGTTIAMNPKEVMMSYAKLFVQEDDE